jgi:phosphatidylglycerophosphatase A
MNNGRFMVGLATLGPLGYLIAPGTVASCLTIPFIFGITQVTGGNAIAYFLFFLAFAITSFCIIDGALAVLRCHHDPSEIVLDEVVGMVLTFWMIPLTTSSLVLGLILFRFFDIIKLGPVKESQRLPGAWGILGDDLLAALLSNIILRFLF